MAVMQTPHGRVIGLILQEGDQPRAVASEKAPGNSLGQAMPDSSLGEGAKVEAKPATVKKAGRTAKK